MLAIDELGNFVVYELTRCEEIGLQILVVARLQGSVDTVREGKDSAID